MNTTNTGWEQWSKFVTAELVDILHFPPEISLLTYLSPSLTQASRDTCNLDTHFSYKHTWKVALPLTKIQMENWH